jgi:hypothetical protein
MVIKKPATRLEVGRQRRHRQMQDGQVHREEHGRQHQHEQPDPLAPAGPGRVVGCVVKLRNCGHIGCPSPTRD